MILLGVGLLLDRRHETLPVIGTVPAFALTDHMGGAVSAADLTGHVWIAAFIFTRCPDVCPALTSRMATLQQELNARGDEPVRLVSFSVDPTHDTPAVLQTFAGRFHAGPEWTFVTGDRGAIARLLRDGFRVAFADDGPPDAPITHSDRLVLVDRDLHIRGYYRGGDATDIARLLGDAHALRAGAVS